MIAYCKQRFKLLLDYLKLYDTLIGQKTNVNLDYEMLFATYCTYLDIIKVELINKILFNNLLFSKPTISKIDRQKQKI